MFARNLLLMGVFTAGCHADQLAERTAIRDLANAIEQANDHKLYLGFGDFSSHQSAFKLKVSSLVELEEKNFQELKTLVSKAEYKPIKNYLIDDIPNVILFKSKIANRWIGLYSYPYEGGKQIVFYSQVDGMLTLVDQTNLFSDGTLDRPSKRLCLHISALPDTTLIKRLLDEDKKMRQKLLKKDAEQDGGGQPATRPESK